MKDGEPSDPQRTRTLPAGEPSPGRQSPAIAAALRAGLPPSTERFIVEEEIGAGGLGVVVSARDLKLDRLVAVKTLRVHDAQLALRFRREALITASLGHPSVVPIYDLGNLPDGDPYYAMKLVKGETLHERIKQAKTPGARIALVPHVIAVADAIAFAHSERVIHRDLKPANVLCGAFGETVVIDWGLAKRIGEPDVSSRSLAVALELTQAGEVMGTPAYMAPEQGRGLADERSDVFALGGMLFHVLAGQAPSPTRTLAEHAPGTPPDLAAIVAKAMAREPGDRYPSGKELAEDLRRFVAGQLVGAHRYSTAALIRRWLRRHRAIVTVAGVLLLALAATAIVSVRRIVEERNVAETRNEALKLSQARGALARDPTAAIAWLKQSRLDEAALPAVRAIADEARALGVALAVLAGPDAGYAVIFAGTRVISGHRDSLAVWDGAAASARIFEGHEDIVWRLAGGRDGAHLASGSQDGTVRWWRLDDGTHRVLGRHGRRVNSIVVGASFVASSSADGTIGVWPLDGAPGRWLAGHEGTVNVLALSPDEARLASAGIDGRVRLWTLATGEVREVARHEGEIDLVAFTPDGREVVSAGYDGAVRVDGRPLRESGPAVMAMAVGASGVAVGGNDGSVALLDWKGGSRRFPGHGTAVSALKLSPDGAWLASASYDASLRVSGLRSGTGRTLRGHRGVVTDLAFSDDGTRLASVAGDGDVRLWAMVDEGIRTLRFEDGMVQVAFHAGGRGVAATTQAGAVFVWDGDGEPRRVAASTGRPSLALAKDGRLGVAWSDGRMGIWRWSGELVLDTRLDCGELDRAAFSPDGVLLAVSCSNGDVVLLDTARGTTRVLPGVRRPAWELAFSPDGSQLASAGIDKRAQIWEFATGEARDVDVGARVFKLTFSPDGTQLLAAGERGVRVIDVASGAVEILAGHRDWVFDVEVLPDGRTAASTGHDRTIRLWDLAGGRPPRILEGHQESVFDLAISPDGRTLASVDRDGKLRFWNIATGTARVLAGHEGPCGQVVFSPDGTRLATASDDGTVRLWPATTTELPASPDGVARWLAEATSAVVSGERVVTRP